MQKSIFRAYSGPRDIIQQYGAAQNIKMKNKEKLFISLYK
jgi:hypothetical protein